MLQNEVNMNAKHEDYHVEAELDEEREVSEERFSYQKEAEVAMRRAEEKALAREAEFQEYQEKRRRGEIQDDTSEVIDTLRWPSAQDDLAGDS